jgi:ubiquinone/menaquinone biosynthesis C-methylase UbiE
MKDSENSAGSDREHWQSVYKTKNPTDLSWYQSRLEKSLEFISAAGIPLNASILDVGGGASNLADDLLAKKYERLTVLDLSSEALEKAKERLANLADKVTWIEADITKVSFPANSFDLWHDRAVFHFLTGSEQRQSYLKVLRDSLKPGGFLIMATFSLEGPLKCSGLEVMRYSPETLSRELGEEFQLLKSSRERHQTPFDTFQNFIYCLYQRKSEISITSY